jgi:dTDP-4-amino-4,6-dideoxygalactose transaminase
VCFADVCGSEDLTIDPADIERQITPHTRAIAVMHYGGFPCHMEEIMAVAKRHNLPVIEDGAHCPGASLSGKMLGSWGAVGCFSFFSNKNLSTGEGGMIVTDDDEIANRIRLQRSHGMTTLTYDRHKGHAYSYDVVDLGFNYRIDEIRAALGLEQLKKLHQNNGLRQTWTELYRQKLANVDVEVPFLNQPGQPAYHLFPVVLPKGVDRKQVIDSMRLHQIQTSIHYPPTHCFTYYTGRYGSTSLPRTEDIAGRELTLPLYPTMGEEAVELVTQALVDALETRS